MQMDAGLDTGDMLLAEAVAVRPDDSAATLHDRLAALGGRLIVTALGRIEDGSARRERQPDEGVTYARKIDKAEARIDWRLPAAVIERRLRAFDPFPGAVGVLAGEALKLWRGVPSDGRGAPGEVLAAADDGLLVACGDGALRLTELQRPGGRRLAAAQWLRSRPVRAGERFEPADGMPADG